MVYDSSIRDAVIEANIKKPSDLQQLFNYLKKIVAAI